MIDTHCHILPGVDDGAKTMDECIEMAKIAASEGIHHIIATPHYIQHSDYLNKKQLEEVVCDVNEQLKLNEVKLTISLGQEVFLTPDLPKLLKEEEITTLNESSYLLIEFPMNDIPMYAEDVIYELKLMGITPIIAHPERYPKVIEDPNIMHKFLTLGALSQVNVGSILGLFGEKVQETAYILMEHNMVHLSATDAHSCRRRAPKMQKALTQVTKLDPEMARLLFMENPFKVYNNLEIETLTPKEYKKPTIMTKILNVFKKSS
ncbi:MAG TPA: capsular biosynthesis protein [Firmicutes bacterium]|nr:capsular biosynthesis protein [Bacillota bacterium]